MSDPGTAWSDEAGRRVLAGIEEPTVLVALQAVQAEFGYVPAEAVPLVAQGCNASRADVFGVLTYYRDLRQAPPEGPEVRICMGEACQAVGARALIDAVRSRSGAACEVSHVYCLGNCALGPSAAVAGRLLGRATTDTVAGALSGERG